MKLPYILTLTIPLTLAVLPASAGSAGNVDDAHNSDRDAKIGESQTITGGNVTVFISNMDKAVRFYTQTLGLKLAERYGDHWATIDAGNGLSIGLLLASPNDPKPGLKGAMTIGLEINEPIDRAVSQLKAKGVRFTSNAIKSEGGIGARFEDPDGNELYLWQESQN
ncbi:MAG: VOC family protein [Rhizomicrobium sp.]|jgi:catechol 2,3-dioxygenase-like lactoylglutathione lyase family enzyme